MYGHPIKLLPDRKEPLTSPMTFYAWIIQLAVDAAQKGLSHRLRSISAPIWLRIYQEGVQPSVRAICDWAAQDPERFKDLRETETEHTFQIAA
jgi:hypothetical protein